MPDIESILREERRFPASEELRREAPTSVRWPSTRRSTRGPRRTPTASGPRWRGALDWIEPWNKVLDWQAAVRASWFVGGKLNLSAQLPRPAPRRRAATRWRSIWEGEPGRSADAHLPRAPREVCRFANVLDGARRRRPATASMIYMPMIPEVAVAMLACARIGATHSVVFGGFSAEALRDRINDCRRQAHHHRRRRLAARQGRAAQGTTSTTRCDAAARRVEERRRRARAPAQAVAMARAGATCWWHELMREAPRADARRASRSTPSTRSSSSTPRGTTGKPKGVVHTTGGYLLGAHLHDADASSTCARRTSTGAPPTSAGSPATATSSTARSPTARPRVMYEGAPDFPEPRTASGASSSGTRSRSSTPRRRRSAPSCAGATSCRRSTICRRCASSAPSASRSTPRPGCGTSERHRRRPLPDRRHLVADRDRRAS